MEQQMKKIGLRMSILMAVTMSFFLSLTGTLHGTRNSPQGFTVRAWIISFLISLVISLVIGFLVPMGKISRSIAARMGPGTMKARFADALVSDLIYTPIITLCMVFIAWRNATAQAAAHGGQGAPFIAMFVPSFFLCFFVGYGIIFICQPRFMKLLMKNALQIPGGKPEGKSAGKPGSK